MQTRNNPIIILSVLLFVIACGDKSQKEQAAANPNTEPSVAEEPVNVPTTAIGAMFQVDDFGKWTSVYNREVDKSIQLGMLRSLENPNLIFVIQRSENHTSAKEMASSQEALEIMKEGTMSSDPQFQYYDIRYYTDAPATDEYRLAVTAEVLNYEMWKGDFDRDEFNREEAGLNLIGLATDSENDNLVYILFSCADQQKVYDFMSSEDTKRAISDSGVIGEPNMTWWREP